MKLKHLIYTALAGCCLAGLNGCSEDDDLTSSVDYTANRNANPSTTAYANRLEIPRLNDNRVANLFLIHSTPEYGINLCIEWDCTRRAQRWTAYQMYAGNSAKNWNRNYWYQTEWGGDPFQVDPTIPAAYRSTLDQYRGSGYNRGHICASADRLCSKDANEQTFYLSNMQPQVYGFNAGVWEHMEELVRTWNRNDFRDTLYVVKGGTIDRADQILRTTSKGLLVPKYFFMAVLCKNNNPGQYGYKAMAFWAEHTANDDTKLRNYMISVDELEARTGIDFFCNLPDYIENVVEANITPSVWGL